MKKILLTALLVVPVLLTQAQRLEKAKDLLGKKDKLADARTEIDKVLAIEKNQQNPEAWLVKSKIYLKIAADQELKNSVPDARDVAFDALKKYMELDEQKEKDEKKRYMLLTLENNQPLIDIYTGYNKDAASFYNAGNYNDALTNFKNALAVFDLIAKREIVPIKLDTTTTLYAGISAEKANKIDEAATYYGKIAEAKAQGEGFVEIYKWLADHYRRKGNIEEAIKFTTLGREVYPEDPFWSGFELEMLRDQGSKEQLFAKYEQVINENPDNHVYLFNYGVELYQTAYKEDISERPANSKELIEKARTYLNKAMTLKPDYANVHMVLGQMSYNEGVDYSKENDQIRPTGGQKLTADQLAKKEKLRQATLEKFDEAIPYFKKVDELLDSQGKLKMEEKETLKGALDLMIIAMEEKARQLEQKRLDAERKKNDAEEKRLEAELKQVTAEIAKYTDKFNNVDRKH
jgi:tetratricopeptide (TPR) repeat protein